MSDTKVTVEEIDWHIFYNLTPGDPGRMGASILPEDSYPPEPAEVEITGIYLDIPKGDFFDLIDVIDEDIKIKMEDHILENTE